MNRDHATASLELTGTCVGRNRPARCTSCGAHLFDDAPITGYAYRFTDEPTLSVARLYCTPCERHRIDHPTLGAHEVQFCSSLRREQNSFTLANVEVLEYSDPTETARDTLGPE